MTVLFTYNFPSLSYKILHGFLKFYFSHFTFQVRLFFVEKKEPKLFSFKNVVARGIRKFLTFVIRQVSSKISEK